MQKNIAFFERAPRRSFMSAFKCGQFFFTFGGFITFVINYCICGFNTARSSVVDVTTSFLLNLLFFEDVVH